MNSNPSAVSRLWAAVLFYALQACTGSPSARDAGASQADGAKSMFRTVHLGRGEVTLGEPLRDKAALGQVFGDTALQIANAKFGGADAIWVSLAPGDTVRSMTYEYGLDTAFDARVNEYVKLLGQPARRFTRGAPEHLSEVVQWEDSATHFELQWVPQGSGAVARSILSDRRMIGH